MKTKISILLFAVFLLFTVSSCSKDDDEVGNTTSKEARIFVGKWEGYYKWEFKEDGTCIYSASKDYKGIWKYEADSRTLITNVSITGDAVWSWKIISLSEDMWVGEHLSGKKGTYTYTRIK